MEDRFSLLYLEPGEIYFTDVAVTFCQNPDAKENTKTQLTPLSSTKKQEPFKSKGTIYSSVVLIIELFDKTRGQFL